MSKIKKVFNNTTEQSPDKYFCTRGKQWFKATKKEFNDGKCCENCTNKRRYRLRSV